jgi:hypothetical protein
MGNICKGNSPAHKKRNVHAAYIFYTGLLLLFFTGEAGPCYITFCAVGKPTGDSLYVADGRLAIIFMPLVKRQRQIHFLKQTVTIRPAFLSSGAPVPIRQLQSVVAVSFLKRPGFFRKCGQYVFPKSLITLHANVTPYAFQHVTHYASNMSLFISNMSLLVLILPNSHSSCNM